MADVIKIEGGHRLKGEVTISSAKNATVALIPAATLADNCIVDIYGVPNIADVNSLIILLEELGVKVSRENDSHLKMDTTQMKNVVLDHVEVSNLRASYYFMGALLGKYKYVKMQMPGGCYLGPRPIDLHLKGFEALGAKINYTQGYYEIVAERLIGAKIFLDIASVGATMNIMMAAVKAEGRTIIENAAKEPEIIDLATFLNKMGAKVRGAGTSVITIDGVETLNGSTHEIIPDRIEAGTYMIMAAAMGEEVKINNIIPLHLEALTSKLIEMGVDIEIGSDFAVIRGGNPLKAIDIQTLPYPGFATDLQQPLTTLLSQASGRSTIRETIYFERFKHVDELKKMGAKMEVNAPTAFINGPTTLVGTDVEATDLRCGAALVVAGLIAQGVTTIDEVYHIDRGYDKLDEKLRNLGAKIWREPKVN